jgi:hypothetical protein
VGVCADRFSGVPTEAPAISQREASAENARRSAARPCDTNLHAIPCINGALSRLLDDLERIIPHAGVRTSIPMFKDLERREANRRREQALRMLEDHEKRAKAKRTNELLLDRELLRQASIRAGLRQPDNG